MSVFTDDRSLREPTVDELVEATKDPVVQALRRAMEYADREVAALKSAEVSYWDPGCPPRQCDKCGQTYTGPAVYCSLRCATADA